MVDDAVQIQVTHPDRQALQSLVDELVEGRAIASANITGPLASTYRWSGRVEHAEEWLAFMKTTRAKIDEVFAAVAENHPYEVPAVMVFSIDDGFTPYLEWIQENTKANPGV